MLYSNTFRIIDDISSVFSLFVCFFFRQSIVHYQSNSMSQIQMQGNQGNLKPGVLNVNFMIIIDELFNFGFLFGVLGKNLNN